MENRSYFSYDELEARLQRQKAAGTLPAWLSETIEVIARYADRFPYQETDEESFVVEFIYPH